MNWSSFIPLPLHSKGFLLLATCIAGICIAALSEFSLILVGPAGLIYDGEYRNDPIEIAKRDELIFELRIHQNPGTFTVCESSGSDIFQPSSLLRHRLATAKDMCMIASKFPHFSRPYTVRVRFEDSVSDSSELTERRVKLVLGNNCNNAAVRSDELTVIGKCECMHKLAESILGYYILQV